MEISPEELALAATLTDDELIANSENPNDDSLVFGNRPDTAAALNVLAAQTLTCLKLCQEERPKVKNVFKSHSNRGGVRSKFAYDFALELVRLESCLNQYINACGMSYFKGVHEIADMDKDSNIVEVRVMEDQILIRMPYLAPAGKFPRGTLVLDVLFEKLLYANPPKWQRWNIDFCQVYARATICMARDVDNSYYKPVIDTIALALGNTDSATYFSMSADSIVDESIPGGTYIRVTKRAAENPVIRAFKNTQKV